MAVPPNREWRVQRAAEYRQAELLDVDFKTPTHQRGFLALDQGDPQRSGGDFRDVARVFVEAEQLLCGCGNFDRTLVDDGFHGEVCA